MTQEELRKKRNESLIKRAVVYKECTDYIRPFSNLIKKKEVTNESSARVRPIRPVRGKSIS